MIVIKSDAEIQCMRRAGKIVGDTLLMLEEVIKPGISTEEIDRIAEDFIRKQGAIPSFKGLYGFPASICSSVNEEVIHGIPSKRILNEGDIISIDCGALIDGFHGDAARTFPVGSISEAAQKLIDVTRESFFKGIEEIKVNCHLGDVGYAIQSHVEAMGFSVVRDFVGHGIGRKLHEDPNVPNFGIRGRGLRLKSGMVLAIEPMVNEGTHHIVTLDDEWTVVTKDKKLSAHYENTVAILEDRVELLTLSN
ncbi:type I methionyl aminopeptidase [Clostridium cellulovorans]|uniref:Methionine aminopeptidase n=1 Tax=Clostridium cellulovorans (strain ATCC 35296 / DSM 3052 / OCM 3 / 743B) TaxID=573061 RepID=D9SX78_CLOC7|nr:type I methionyl aminopeptidase [Clostridium cellulovorans]ADL53381.1 methionine aminopeptidase, type I [Clostridium cellulovorans 743B]